jgi:hypothetical protein
MLPYLESGRGHKGLIKWGQRGVTLLYSFGDRLVELLDQFSTIRASVWWVKVICDALSALRAFRFWHSAFTSRGLSQLLLFNLNLWTLPPAMHFLCQFAPDPCTIGAVCRVPAESWA